MYRFLTILVLLSALVCAWHLYVTHSATSGPQVTSAEAKPSVGVVWPGPHSKPSRPSSTKR